MRKTVATVQWLLQPESDEELPQPAPDGRSTWANAVKTFFWMTTAIAVGLLIAQLG